MGYLKINLEDELLNKFKNEVIKRYGYFKGALSIAGREAIKLWLKLPEKETNKSFEVIREITVKNLTSIEREFKKFRKSFKLRA
jgi:hypothetical protein